MHQPDEDHAPDFLTTEWNVPGDEYQAQDFSPETSQSQPQAEDPVLTCGDIPDGFGPPDLAEDQYPEEATNFGMVLEKSRACQVCHKTFASNNKLHMHLRTEHPSDPNPTEYANVAVAGSSTKWAAHQVLDKGKVVSSDTHQFPPDQTRTEHTRKTNLPIVRSSVDSRPDIRTGFTYKSKTYLKMYIMTSPDEHEEDVCGDTGCTRTIGDKSWII